MNPLSDISGQVLGIGGPYYDFTPTASLFL